MYKSVHFVIESFQNFKNKLNKIVDSCKKIKRNNKRKIKIQSYKKIKKINNNFKNQKIAKTNKQIFKFSNKLII